MEYENSMSQATLGHSKQINLNMTSQSNEVNSQTTEANILDGDLDEEEMERLTQELIKLRRTKMAKSGVVPKMMDAKHYTTEVTAGGRFKIRKRSVIGSQRNEHLPNI